MIEDKGFEKFKELFGTVENEEGELQNSFKRFIHPAFDVKQCSKHRNSIEVFSYNQCYFIVSKSFSHKIGNTRLQMRIWKMTPGNDEEEASVERLHKVDWPIVDKNACFDPSMISVIQWEKNLYYFKVINQIGDTASKVDIIFQMYRYDLVEEEESLVREFNYNWKAAAADHEELLSPAALSQKVEEEGQAEAEG